MPPRITYDLPDDRIALHPSRPRDACRLMVIKLPSLQIDHILFSGIGKYLSAGDVVAVNDSSVIGARLTGRKLSGGSVEFLLLERNGDLWKALGRPAARLRAGMEVSVEKNRKRATVKIEGKEAGGVLYLKAPPDIIEYGLTPLPPYIASRRSAAKKDKNDYQSIFASKSGSVAAPTSSLHFTGRLVRKLMGKGVAFAPVTLHIGAGTFRPGEKPESERYELSPASAGILNRGTRICVTGTTVMRTLQTVYTEKGFRPSEGRTGLYIEPGFRFRAAQMFLTNFHLPETSLLDMVAAYIDQHHPGRGGALLVDLYREALSLGYRFLSYGDSMLLISEDAGVG